MSQYPSQYERGSEQANAPWALNYGAGEERMTLARFFNVVYAWMAVGLVVTAIVGYVVAHSSLAPMLYASKGVYLVIGLAAFGLAWFVQSQVGKLSMGVSIALFMVYATIIGALTSAIHIIYPVSTLVAAFLLTAGTFGAMSVYGFVTKRDLTGIGSIAVMLAFGFIIASFVNIFLASNTLSWIITYAILVLFVIITAYETQMLKRMALDLANNAEMANKVAIVGALVLYISFINLFLSILRILGSRDE